MTKGNGSPYNNPRNQMREWQTKSVLGGAGKVCTYADIDAAELHNFVTKVTSEGAAVTFALVGDKGAYSISVMAGNVKYKDWPKNADDVLRFMHELLEDLI